MAGVVSCGSPLRNRYCASKEYGILPDQRQGHAGKLQILDAPTEEMEMKLAHVYTVRYAWEIGSSYVFVCRKIGFYILVGSPPQAPF